MRLCYCASFLIKKEVEILCAIRCCHYTDVSDTAESFTGSTETDAMKSDFVFSFHKYLKPQVCCLLFL